MEKARQYSALRLGLAWLLPLGLMAPAGAAAQQVASLPSGLQVQLIEVLLDPDLELARFRLLAPALAEPGVDLDALRPDFDLLCAEIAIPVMAARQPDWDEVVISLSSAPLPFGQTDPSVVQAFEGYLIEDGVCIWQDF